MNYSNRKIEAWARFLRTHSMVLARVQADLKSAGLPPLEWYDVLLELKLAAGRRLRMHELSHAVLLSRSNLSRLCDRLARDGLIERQPSDEDGRGAFSVLTAAGLEMQRRIWKVYQASIQRHFANKLSERDAEHLVRIMLTVRADNGAMRPANVVTNAT